VKLLQYVKASAISMLTLLYAEAPAGRVSNNFNIQGLYSFINDIQASKKGVKTSRIYIKITMLVAEEISDLMKEIERQQKLT